MLHLGVDDVTASWHIWPSKRQHEEDVWILGIREWQFQGDRPDYRAFRKITKDEAFDLVSLNLAETSYTDELFTPETVVEKIQKETLEGQ